MRRRACLGSALTVLAAIGGFGCAPTDDMPPNVILISIDTLRADHVGSYKYSRPTTPVLDSINALLTDAIQYERLASRAARRILRSRTRGGFVELGAREQHG